MCGGEKFTYRNINLWGCTTISVDIEILGNQDISAPPLYYDHTWLSELSLMYLSDPRYLIRMGDSFRDAAWDNQLDNMLDDLQSSVSSRGETHGYKNGYHNGTNGHTSREYQVRRETVR